MILATGGNGIGEEVQGCGALPPATRMTMARKKDCVSLHLGSYYYFNLGHLSMNTYGKFAAPLWGVPYTT